MVELTVVDCHRVELHDARTGLQILLEDLTPPLFEGQDARVPVGELAGLCADLGMIGRESLADVRARQRAYRMASHQAEHRARLAAFMRFVTSAVPYYRAQPELYALSTGDPEVALRGWPRLTKRVLRGEFERLIPDGVALGRKLAAGELELVSTSGTTCERVQAIADLELSRIPPDFEEIWDLPAFERTPRTAVLTSPGCMGAAGCRSGELSRRERLKRDHTLFVPTGDDLFALDRRTIAGIVEELHAFQPDFLFVNPVYAHWIGRQAASYGLTFPPITLVLSSYQYLSEIQRRALTRLFHAPVRNLYTATELGGCQLGLECKAGRLHLREDHAWIEILAGERPAYPGELGSIVVTTLASHALPLARYDLGDLASPCDEPCGCPMQDWPSFLLHGRASETLRLGGRLLTTRAFDELVSSFAGIDFYTARPLGDEAIRVDVVPALHAPLDAAAVTAGLREALAGSNVELRIVNALEPAPSLKYPLVLGAGAAQAGQ